MAWLCASKENYDLTRAFDHVPHFGYTSFVGLNFDAMCSFYLCVPVGEAVQPLAPDRCPTPSVLWKCWTGLRHQPPERSKRRNMPSAPKHVVLLGTHVSYRDFTAHNNILKKSANILTKAYIIFILPGLKGVIHV